jgi:phosphoribosylaminoimidazolecarboxamide formyltransferase / IMP cyclohydrolase
VKTIKRALISVYYKDGLEEIALFLNKNGVEILSTGGTYDFLKSISIPAIKVEEITGYPSILGGRVKTLHPKVFGGILARRDNISDTCETEKYEIPQIDLVIVDLYPFEEFVKAGAQHEDIIEKIDIGGISLIRAAAKNYKDVVIISCKELYRPFMEILKKNGANTTEEERAFFASCAFDTTSGYDSAIFHYLNRNSTISSFKKNYSHSRPLRYGENPHQTGTYFGEENSLPKQLHGKEISHNNLLDIEAAIELISDFDDTTVAVIKHTNACGCACGSTVVEAWKKALAADPVSAFGGIIVTNREVDTEAAEEINKLFFEVIIAPSYSKKALDILEAKKNRIILVNEGVVLPAKKFRSLLNGVLVQDRDSHTETPNDLKSVTVKKPAKAEIDDLLFANKLVKHSKSNAIVLAKNRQLLASGVGQTSRVDSLKQAIEKAKAFNFELKGAVMASDAFFPFHDCVEIAAGEGIKTIIQPGGSVRDQESIDWCNNNDVAMVFTGFRHFKH